MWVTGRRTEVGEVLLVRAAFAALVIADHGMGDVFETTPTRCVGVRVLRRRAVDILDVAEGQHIAGLDPGHDLGGVLLMAGWAVPSPPLKFGYSGSQAMSPAVTTTTPELLALSLDGSSAPTCSPARQQCRRSPQRPVPPASVVARSSYCQGRCAVRRSSEAGPASRSQRALATDKPTASRDGAFRSGVGHGQARYQSIDRQKTR